MVELVGGALVMLGGGALSGSALILHRAQRTAVEIAAELLGSTDNALPPPPTDMTALLDRIP